MNQTETVLLLLIVGGAVMLGAGCLAGIGTNPIEAMEFNVEVSTVNVPDLPLCDAMRTTKCAASKVDWNTLQVHTAPGVTRAVVGDAFLPNAKE